MSGEFWAELGAAPGGRPAEDIELARAYRRLFTGSPDGRLVAADLERRLSAPRYVPGGEPAAAVWDAANAASLRAIRALIARGAA